MRFRLEAWLKNHTRDIVLFALLFLVSTISFGLGYLVADQVERAPIIIEKATSH
jgi:hypothetical protein